MPTSPTLTRALPLLAAAATIALVAAGCGTSNADPARGRALFIQTCGSCHTLAQAATTGTQGPNLDDAFAAANAGGTTGPNLDKVLPGQSATQITQSIVDPNAKITPGYPSSVMPQTFKTLIPPAQLKQLVQYLISSTGGAKASGKKKK